MSEPWERVAVAAGLAYASNMMLFMSVDGSRFRVDPPKDLSRFFTLGGNSKTICRWPTADGKPCRSRGFVGEYADEHFYKYHPPSKHRVVCVLCDSFVGASDLKRHLVSRHADDFTAIVMERGPFEKGGWKLSLIHI